MCISCVLTFLTCAIPVRKLAGSVHKMDYFVHNPYEVVYNLNDSYVLNDISAENVHSSVYNQDIFVYISLLIVYNH